MQTRSPASASSAGSATECRPWNVPPEVFTESERQLLLIGRNGGMLDALAPIGEDGARAWSTSRWATCLPCGSTETYLPPFN